MDGWYMVHKYFLEEITLPKYKYATDVLLRFPFNQVEMSYSGLKILGDQNYFIRNRKYNLSPQLFKYLDSEEYFW